MQKSDLLAGSDLHRSLARAPTFDQWAQRELTKKQKLAFQPACPEHALIISKSVLVAPWHMPFLGIVTNVTA